MWIIFLLDTQIGKQVNKLRTLLLTDNSLLEKILNNYGKGEANLKSRVKIKGKLSNTIYLRFLQGLSASIKILYYNPTNIKYSDIIKTKRTILMKLLSWIYCFRSYATGKRTWVLMLYPIWTLTFTKWMKVKDSSDSFIKIENENIPLLPRIAQNYIK